MRTLAVGLYPAGAAPCGALDMAGNAWEWCLNKYAPTEDTRIGGNDDRALRGGSWVDDRGYCRAAFRNGSSPLDRVGFGFRLCLSSPIAEG
jgi:formylglycine-generating enzyme required for sulfatase activity